jgi:hypothetical protein
MAVSTYKSLGILSLLTDEQHAYYNDYQALDEAGLTVDTEHWAKHSSWLLAEGAFIIHGICPEKGLKYMPDIPPALLHKVRATFQVSERAALDGKLSKRGDPLEYLNWARIVDLPVASQLRRAVVRHTVKRAEYQLDGEARLIDVAALREPTDEVVEAKQLPKRIFWAEQLSSNFGYLPPLEDVLERLSAEGCEVPDSKTMYQHLEAQKDRLTSLRFCPKDNTLSYQNADNRWIEVKFKAIGQAIKARVSYKAPPNAEEKD